MSSVAKEDLKRLVGQLFLVGFDGYSVPEEWKKFALDYNITGTIYFKRNVQSPAQLAELSNDVQFNCRGKYSPPMIISIDHEGGKVNRLVKPFTKFPGNDYIGDIDSPKVAFEFGQVLGKELKAIGVNVNFAPVLDVNTNPKSKIIGSRAFSSDPEVCARMGSAVCRGLQKMGVMAVGKHFPGHGCVEEDSHLTLPKMNRTLEELESIELIPFRKAIKARVEGIMTAHILNKALDPEFPVTLSKPILTDILRENLRYNKIIYSDDMEMQAITEHYSPEQAAVLAVAAGCDILIYRGDNGLPIPEIEAIVKAVEDGVIPQAQLEASYQRIFKAKKAYADVTNPIDVTEVGNNIGLPEHFKLADQITRKEAPANEA